MVSIIIINYDKVNLTIECIKSIYAKTISIKFEIIVVDNASPTECPDILLTKFPDIQLIKSSNNLGFAGGNNLGLKHTKGNQILLLNNDTILENDAVSICSNYLDSHQDCAVVGPKIFNFSDNNIQHNCQRFPSPTWNIIEFLRIQKLLTPNQRGKLLFGSFFNHDEEANPDWLWGTFFMFPKKVLDNFNLGKLPDTFFMYFEDMQWCLELNRKGLKTAFEPKAKIRHHMKGSQGNKKQMMVENQKKFLKLYFPWWYRELLRFTDFLLSVSTR